jgi:hypothetical protein
VAVRTIPNNIIQISLKPTFKMYPGSKKCNIYSMYTVFAFIFLNAEVKKTDKKRSVIMDIYILVKQDKGKREHVYLSFK